jgi:transcriptional regulator with XRE-family HTH domain
MKTLKQYREETGKTLIEVAEAVATSDATISRIERGLQSPGKDLARRLEALTGISAGAYMLGEAGEQATSGAST